MFEERVKSKTSSPMTMNSFGKFPVQHLQKIKRKDYYVQRHIVIDKEVKEPIVDSCESEQFTFKSNRDILNEYNLMVLGKKQPEPDFPKKEAEVLEKESLLRDEYRIFVEKLEKEIAVLKKEQEEFFSLRD